MLLTNSRLVLATHNPGKVREIKQLLQSWAIYPIPASDMGLIEPVETGSSFAENATLKAKLAAYQSGLPALADDSGLCVNGLGGRPGIYSARWAGESKDFGQAMQQVENELTGQNDRSAYFTCALCLFWPDGMSLHAEAKVDGQIVWPPQGNNGFGYDPIFRPAGYDLTFGQMLASDKYAIDHRAKAFAELTKMVVDV